MCRFKNIILLYFLIPSIIFMNGCKHRELIQSDTIRDIRTLKQSSRAYINSEESTKSHIPKKHQLLITKDFKTMLFSPWNNKKIIKKKLILSDIRYLFKNKKYGENKQEISQKSIKKIISNCNLDSYPNKKKYAITINNTNLRLLPTKKPLFSEFSDNSNGYPFDILQNSMLPANTPIFVIHITKDHSWVFVQTAFASGWVHIHDIAYAGPKFRKKYKSYPTIISATQDNFPVRTYAGNYLYDGYIGMVFPLIKKSKNNFHIATAMADGSRYAYVKEAVISDSTAQKMPLKPNTNNISMICDRLMDQPYGWGGLYNNRDCSALIRDIFIPFGIWLPRHSSMQAKQGGRYIELKNFSEETKKEIILKNATPFLTLLWFPGHIMLYIGQENGTPLVFHNIWGIRTNNEEKRKIIGKSVITTLQPGKELKEINEKSNFLNRLEAMTLLTPRY